MSRSYKKHPSCGDSKGKVKKRIANKAVRSKLKQDTDLILSGGDFKKLFESWDICDYMFVRTWEEYWESCVYWSIHSRYHRNPPDFDEEYRYWVTHYKSK